MLIRFASYATARGHAKMLHRQQRARVRVCSPETRITVTFASDRLPRSAPTATQLLSETAPDSTAETVARLSAAFAATAAERDERGGTPKAERDALRTSGLLALSIPKEHGGLGATWGETLQVVRELSKADGSVGHVFGFHHLMLATVQLFAHPAQWQPWLDQTARRRWFWGNALNPLDNRTASSAHGEWHEFNGRKSFCSGAIDSEMMIASAREQGSGALVIAALPTARSGITVEPDWNNMGQRQTDSGSVTFEAVRVELHELLVDPGPLSTPRSCLRPLVSQLMLANIYLGIAEAAFRDAKHYTLNESRPWHSAKVAHMEDDPYVLGHYGEFWVGIEAARVLADRAAERLDTAWQRGPALTADERGDVAVAIAVAKIAATRTGLDLCTRMFEVAGARATHGSLRLDRHWRNLRTHTLHDPIAYKLRELGEWALMHRHPDPSFYS